ncbi:hypothetical protein SBRCBS47491_005243 [Sporothrix bragantina]|uniref:SUN domain-containing protein n=1 Tax=Sporothrix bragantina TaxID=671064 RepID=A0ABP0BVB9_9PEZI
MPRGFMLYVSAAAVGLLGFGQPVPAEASDASQASAMTTNGHDTAAATTSVVADIASSIASSISSASSSISSSSTTSISSTTSSISVTMTPSSSSSFATPFYDTETCQSKTINYITHTLPQQCLRTSWSSANATSSITDSGSATAAPPSETAPAAAAGNASEADSKDAEKDKGKEDDENKEDLATESFMSFEEWKVLQLKKAGQDPAELQARRRQQQQQQRAGHHAHGAGGDINIDSVGDDGEIALDFDVLNEKVSEMAGSASAHVPGQYHEGNGGYRQDGHAGVGGDSSNAASGGSGSGSGSGSGANGQDDAVVYADGATQYYRSKDAGKTGKERFSFASFDAGATILKTNKGVKNAKAILVENKDSYMLLECRTRDKHVVVEMSDDILVDTVVLANFEFFSSMVRRFRVSVSDRYPVKADRWRTLGEYEARNSRDIQPFLIEHPQIWAKYIRIDFLTHYGSEYYCPISLLRVHGTRMLDSWKDSENGGDDEEELEQEQEQAQDQVQAQEPDQQQPNEQQQYVVQQQEHVEEHAEEQVQQEVQEMAKAEEDTATNSPAGYTPWNPIAAYHKLFYADIVCSSFETPATANTQTTASDPSQHATQDSHAGAQGQKGESQPPQSSFVAVVSSSSATDKAASQPSHTQNAANDAASPSPSSPSSSTSATSNASNASNASSSSAASPSSQSSDSSASPSLAAAKNAEQDAAAPPPGKKTAPTHKPPASPGTHGNQQVPPTTTVQTSHSKNRAASGGSSGAGGSSQQAPGSTHGGSGSNPGATGSSSSTGGGSNSNGNGSGSASGSSGGAPSPPPPPIVQESFFKSITKRLQLLESNTSLSMQYIEDQSRFLQEALRKMERKQISRVDSFLDTLNNTVLSELRNMRQQYDQIWQSTVIALETQREQNQRETVALSDRLNVLADEVVFQKRMAILQSVLLLCCLALVIFSRGLLSGGSASVPLDVNAAAAVAAAAGYMPMPPGSPSSPPSASSSVGIRSNLRSFRNNLRNPYAAYSVYASGHPLSAYSAGSPPPPNGNNPRGQSSMPVGANGSSNLGHGTPVPVNMNKVLPQTPTTPTSPGSPMLPESPEIPESPEPRPSNESQDSLVDTEDGQEPEDVQGKGLGISIAAPKPLTLPESLRLSDIEEAADQMEEEDEADSSEDRDDMTILSEATLVGPNGSRAGGDDDDLRLFTPRAVTPTLAVVSEDDPVFAD